MIRSLIFGNSNIRLDKFNFNKNDGCQIRCIKVKYDYLHNHLLTDNLPATDRPCPVSRKTSEVGG